MDGVSLPSVVDDEILADVGIFPLLGSAPTFNPLTQDLVELDPVLVDGNWTRQWDVVDADPDDSAARISASRASIREAIKAERDRRIQHGGYKAAGKWFHSDTFSRTQQIGLVMLGENIPSGVMWKTMDGSFVEMTQALASQIFTAAMVGDNAAFARANQLISQVDAAQDPTTIDISSGWPETFRA